MTDLDLLVLAAKAIDLSVWKGTRLCAPETLYRAPDNPSVVVTGVIWDPLHDGNDALRLATALNMAIDVARETGNVWAGNSDGDALLPVEANGDWHAATCRVIVMAAAEMGWKKIKKGPSA